MSVCAFAFALSLLPLPLSLVVVRRGGDRPIVSPFGIARSAIAHRPSAPDRDRAAGAPGPPARRVCTSLFMMTPGPASRGREACRTFSRHERGAAGPVGPLGVRRPRPRRRPRVSLLALAIETAPGRLYGSMGLLSTVKYSGSTLFTHHTANSATSNRGEMQTRAQAGRGLVTCVGSHQTSVWVHYGCQVASAQQVPSSQPCYAGERRIAGALWPLRPFSAPTPEHRMPRHVATQLLLVPDSARR